MSARWEALPPPPPFRPDLRLIVRSIEDPQGLRQPRLRLTRRGERLVAWLVVLLLFMAPGLAEALGEQLWPTPPTTTSGD